ncbi:MAG: MarR family winged helix-turn-helix transcriptional regulator [Dehalococcoidia bacterium]
MASEDIVSAESRTPTDPRPTASEVGLTEATVQLKDALARFFALVEPMRVDLWDRSGLTMGQLRLLFAIRDEAGASTGEIGHAIGLGGSSLTGLVDRVAALGFVRREPDAQDRRVTRLSLTEAGATLLAEFESERDADFAATLAQLAPDERRDLARLFSAFVDAVQRLADERHAAAPDPGGAASPPSA